MSACAECLREAERKLRAACVPDAAWDAWLLFAHVTGWDRSRYFLHQREEMPAEVLEKYWNLVMRRAERIPLQHLTGEADFMGLTFRINEHVLVPRPDTEILAETVLAEADGADSLLDLCTGSGCLAVAFSRLGHFRRVVGSDLSEEALAVARENGRRQGCENLDFVRSDLYEAFPGKRFGVITSNPPYIPTAEIRDLMPEVRDHDPHLALDGGTDGLAFYRRIAAETPEHLMPGGRLYLEIGSDQGPAVRALLETAGFTEIRIRKDLSGLNRVVCARL